MIKIFLVTYLFFGYDAHPMSTITTFIEKDKSSCEADAHEISMMPFPPGVFMRDSWCQETLVGEVKDN